MSKKRVLTQKNYYFSGILKIKPKDQVLYNKDSLLMEDDKTLLDYGITIATAKAQAPAQLGLAVR